MRLPPLPRRLRGDVQARISELIDLHNDPVFSRLPSEEQHFVLERLDELTAYRDYQDQLARIAPGELGAEWP